MSNNEIRVTFMSEEPSKTESMQIGTGMSLEELTLFAAALLNFETQESDLNGRLIQILKDGHMIYSYPSDGDNNGPSGTYNNNAKKLDGQNTVESAGIKDGDLIYVRRVSINNTTASHLGNGSAMNGGGLDFSSLLSSSNVKSNKESFASSQPSNTGLTFSIPPLINNSSSSSNKKSTIVKWKGMTLDEAIRSNPDPKCLCELLLDQSHQADHGNLLKEMAFHHPLLAKRLKQASKREVSLQ